MKKILIYIIASLAFSTLSAQSRLLIGGGFFGQTITHPGLVFEMEYETNVSETMSLPLRFDLGFYNHPRNHTGLFLDVHYGFRRYFKSGLFLEESIGIGVLGSRINTDVYNVDDNGVVSEGSKLNQPQFMPSLTLGIGFNLTRDSQKPMNILWIRPKIAWEYPYKTTASFSPSLQIGYTHQLTKK